jgi:UDPglucose 6-dehydrogenase
MKIAVLGLWHLGCVYAAGSAKFGHTVKAWDENKKTVDELNAGFAPISEPGLNELIKENLDKGLLSFHNNLKDALVDSEIIWITYDTPVDDNDIADCDFVISRIKNAIDIAPENSIFLVSSQLPCGSIKILENYAKEKNRTDLDFACSPENLRLGKAIDVFSNPDRIICGIRYPIDTPPHPHENTTNMTKKKMNELFFPITDKVEFMSPESAEMTKHSINAFLAMSVVFANEIASICEETGADAKEVERGLKTEKRIGKDAYVAPGVSFAGGTLARDIAFLSSMKQSNNKDSILFPAISKSNSRHKLWVSDTVKNILGSLNKVKIAILGLAYKPNTNTLRRSISIEYAKIFKTEGADVFAYDPLILDLPNELKTVINLCANPYEAAKDASVLVIAQNCNDFLNLDAKAIVKNMRLPIIIDPARFLFEKFSNLSDYYTIGLKKHKGTQ